MKIKSRKTYRSDYDSPWKDIIHFISFFFPDIWHETDWTRGYISLEKNCAGSRLADKLMRVPPSALSFDSCFN